MSKALIVRVVLGVALALLRFAVLISATALLAAAPKQDSTLDQRVAAAGSLTAGIALATAAVQSAVDDGDLQRALTTLLLANKTPFIYQDDGDGQVEYAKALQSIDLGGLDPAGRARFEVKIFARVGYSGILDEAQIGLVTLLNSRDHLLDAGSRAEAHYMLAFCAYYLADTKGALLHARLAGYAFLSARDTLSAMEAFDGVATSHLRLGQVDSALVNGRLAMQLSYRVTDTARIQNVYLNYAEALAADGRAKAAYVYLAKAREMTAATQWGLQARAQLAYASVYRTEGRVAERVAALEEAARFFTLNNERHQATDLLDSIAVSYALGGDWRAAYRFRDRAATQRDSLQAERIKKDTDSRLAEVERAALRREREEASHREALAAAVLTNASLQRAVFGVTLAGLCLVIGFGIYRAYVRRQSNAKLQDLVNKRTEALRAQTEELRESNAELERFAYIASHDLKTPLRNVTSFVNLAQRRLPPEAKDAVGEYLQIASDNARQMHALVSDVLEYSRLGRTGEEAAATLSVGQLVGEVRRGMQAELNDRNAIIDVSGDVTAVLPHTALTQVVTNLIENGLKYNRAEVPRITVAIVDMGDAIRIGVQDNGIGIAPEYHAKIFEVFRRLHTVDEFSGTGVGLSSCLKIVKRLGGTIEVESAAGAGATFLVTLPKTRSAPAAPILREVAEVHS